jgi:hypothetical protein
MKERTLLLKVCLILVLFYSVRQGNCLSTNWEVAQNDELDKASKEKIVEEVARLITDKYVYQDVGEKMAAHILDRLKEKTYDHITSTRAFIEALTQDLRSVKNDSHLGVVQRRGPFKKGAAMEDMYQAFYLKRAPFRNYGFIKAERMLGNVGCLVIDEFTYIDKDGKNIGGETAKAAMTLVSRCYALVIDLRDNFGGREEMALLLLSYFFNEPIHILTKLYRERGEKEIWTHNKVSQGILSEVPLYILTSQHTVSGGEMFAYVLKNRKRATLIGEKTRGAAHKTHLFSLDEFKIDAAIPIGATFDPLTQTDWEGVGVEPDITVAAGKAMDVAYEIALEKILSSKVDRSERQEMEWALMEAKARLNPVSLDEASLNEYGGIFGERRIKIENSSLVYQKEGNPSYILSPMTKDVFSFVDKGMFYVRLKFIRDESGAINKIILLFDTGQKDEFQKTGD